MCIHDLKNRTCVVATLQNKKSTCKWCSHVRRDLAPKGKTVRKLTGATCLRQRPNGMLCDRRPKEHIGVHCDFPSACENTSLRVRSDWRAGSMNATWRKAHTMGGLSRQVRNAAAKSRTSIQFSWAGPSGDLVDTLGALPQKLRVDPCPVSPPPHSK